MANALEDLEKTLETSCQVQISGLHPSIDSQPPAAKADSFYRGLTEEELKRASDFNFDHPACVHMVTTVCGAADNHHPVSCKLAKEEQKRASNFNFKSPGLIDHRGATSLVFTCLLPSSPPSASSLCLLPLPLPTGPLPLTSLHPPSTSSLCLLPLPPPSTSSLCLLPLPPPSASSLTAPLPPSLPSVLFDTDALLSTLCTKLSLLFRNVDMWRS
ncbi:unnamed protein product [Closterium sp. Naga37s-1]|nr:unnamed protein product [Closterium sp. Naga37s-1]